MRNKLATILVLIGYSQAVAAAITVYDPWNHTENYLNALRALAQLKEDLTQTLKLSEIREDLLDQLAYDQRHSQQLTKLQTYELEQLFGRLKRLSTLSLEFEQLNSQHQEFFPHWKDESGNNISDYNQQLQHLQQATEDAMRDALRAQSIEQLLLSADEQISDLQNDNINEDSSLALQQLSNELLAVLVKQVILLNNMISVQHRAHSIQQLQINSLRAQDEYRSLLLKKKVDCGLSNCVQAEEY